MEFLIILNLLISTATFACIIEGIRSIKKYLENSINGNIKK